MSDMLLSSTLSELFNFGFFRGKRGFGGRVHFKSLHNKSYVTMNSVGQSALPQMSLVILKDSSLNQGVKHGAYDNNFFNGTNCYNVTMSVSSINILALLLYCSFET